jgi:transglutaminase-like putative cysteine protease
MQIYHFWHPGIRVSGLPRLYLLGIVLLLSPGLTPPVRQAAASDYPVIDAYARATPEAYARSLNTLADYLTAPARSDLGKARSIYTWILTHVSYNDAANPNDFYTSELEYATRVLKSRKAVCTGYALLFKYMLLRAGVEARNIKGYARTQDTDAGLPIRRISHEWNAVKLDDDWYLFDLSWAGSTATGNRSNDYYFLTNPETFIAGHFPADPRWQLLDPVISKAEFDQYPKVHDAYFRLGFGPDFPRHGLIRGQTVTLSLTHPNPDMEFSCSSSRSGLIMPVQTERISDTYQLTLPIAQRGRSTLTLYSHTKGKPYASTALLSFTVVRD